MLTKIYVSIFIWCFLFISKKLINYYYNFYYIYKHLGNKEKLKYFNFMNNYLLKTMLKNNKIKDFCVFYILIPLIKFNYIFISLFATILYSLYEVEFDNFLLSKGISLNISNQSYDNINNIKNNLEYETEENDQEEDTNNYKNLINYQQNSYSEINNSEIKNNKITNLLNKELELLTETDNYRNHGNHINNDKLDDYLLVNDDKNELKINNINDIFNMNNMNNDSDDVVETIRIDEIDFGDVINNIIIKESIKENKEIRPVSNSIRIGKKK